MDDARRGDVFKSCGGVKRLPNLVYLKGNSAEDVFSTLVFMVAGSDNGVFGLLAALGASERRASSYLTFWPNEIRDYGCLNAAVFLMIPLQAKLQGWAEGEIIPQQVIGEEEVMAARVQRCQLSRLEAWINGASLLHCVAAAAHGCPCHVVP